MSYVQRGGHSGALQCQLRDHWPVVRAHRRPHPRLPATPRRGVEMWSIRIPYHLVCLVVPQPVRPRSTHSKVRPVVAIDPALDRHVEVTRRIMFPDRSPTQPRATREASPQSGSFGEAPRGRDTSTRSPPQFPAVASADGGSRGRSPLRRLQGIPVEPAGGTHRVEVPAAVEPDRKLRRDSVSAFADDFQPDGK